MTILFYRSTPFDDKIYSSFMLHILYLSIILKKHIFSIWYCACQVSIDTLKTMSFRFNFWCLFFTEMDITNSVRDT